VSLGQLIAHSVPLSRLDAVCAVFEVLLGGDLFGAIAKNAGSVEGAARLPNRGGNQSLLM